jgi:hypothetical protein
MKHCVEKNLVVLNLRTENLRKEARTKSYLGQHMNQSNSLPFLLIAQFVP